MSVLGTTDNTPHINRRGSAQCRSGGSREWADVQSMRMPKEASELADPLLDRVRDDVVGELVVFFGETIGVGHLGLVPMAE